MAKTVSAKQYREKNSADLLNELKKFKKIKRRTPKNSFHKKFRYSCCKIIKN